LGRVETPLSYAAGQGGLIFKKLSFPKCGGFPHIYSEECLMTNQKSVGAGLILVLILKVLIVIARVGPDVARAVPPPPRIWDDVPVTRPVVDTLLHVPDIADVITDLDNDDE